MAVEPVKPGIIFLFPQWSQGFLQTCHFRTLILHCWSHGPLLWAWMRVNSGCDGAGPSIGRWWGSAAGKRSALLLPQRETQPWDLAATADEQELARDVIQFRFQQQTLGKMTVGTMTQHLLHTPFRTLSIYTKSWKATFLSVGCSCWLVQSTTPPSAFCDEWRRGQKQMMVDTVLGLSSFVYGQTILCHPLDNLVAIPKDVRVTRVVLSFAKLSYSLASSTVLYCSVVFVASAC